MSTRRNYPDREAKFASVSNDCECHKFGEEALGLRCLPKALCAKNPKKHTSSNDGTLRYTRCLLIIGSVVS